VRLAAVREIKAAIEVMDPDAFEDLTFALVLVDHPSARQLRAPANAKHGELAYQGKHHTDGINWNKCRMRALSGWRTPESPHRRPRL
jgi:hypothetical protein